MSDPTPPPEYEPTGTDKLQAEELRSDLFHEVGGWAWHSVVYGLFGGVLAHASGAPWPLCLGSSLVTAGAWLGVTSANAYLKAARKAARLAADEAEKAAVRVGHLEKVLFSSVAQATDTQAAVVKALESHAAVIRQHGEVLQHITNALGSEVGGGAKKNRSHTLGPKMRGGLKVLKGADAEALRPAGVEGDLVAAVELPKEEVDGEPSTLPETEA